MSQNAGNGHFRDSNFQNFMGEHAPDPPRKLTPSAPFCAPSLLEILDSPPAPGLDLYPEMFGGIKGSPSFWGEGEGKGEGEGWICGWAFKKQDEFGLNPEY